MVLNDRRSMQILERVIAKLTVKGKDANIVIEKTIIVEMRTKEVKEVVLKAREELGTISTLEC